MFSGGAPQSAVRQMPSRLGGEPVFSNQRKSMGRPSEFRMRLEGIRIAREPEEIRKAADTFLQFHQLPDDPDILLKILQHPEEKVVREGMGQISSLLWQGRFSNTMILNDRLNDLSARVAEEATRQYIIGLRAQLAKIPSAHSYSTAPAAAGSGNDS